MNNSWSGQVSNDEAARRAGGRRKYNLQRQRNALFRQLTILDWWLNHAASGISIFDRGIRAALAERFGVARSTISRDVTAIIELLNVSACPTCGSPLMLAHVQRLEREGKVVIRDSGLTTKKGRGPRGGHEAAPPDCSNDLIMQLAAQEVARRRKAESLQDDPDWGADDV